MRIEELMMGGKPENYIDKFKSHFLNFLTPTYFIGLNIHKGIYKFGAKRIKKLPRPVICVGNLTLGGSGKTPLVEKIAQEFLKRGIRPAILSRGYKKKIDDSSPLIVSDGRKIYFDSETAGDEPVQIARNCPGIPVVVGAKRFDSGMIAIEKCNTNLLILDDGFQHWALAKDCNILCISSDQDLKNTKLFPAGLRREPFSAIKRCDFIVLTNVSHPTKITPLIVFIKMIDSTKRVFLTKHTISQFVSILPSTNDLLPDFKLKKSPDEFKNLKTLAFCGIANPDGFFNQLNELKLNVIQKLIYDDHYKYSKEDFDFILKNASELKADIIVTTQKDAVKIEKFLKNIPLEIPFYFAQLKIEFLKEIDEKVFFDKVCEKIGIIPEKI